MSVEVVGLVRHGSQARLLVRDLTGCGDDYMMRRRQMMDMAHWT